jgi:hypothetical protein
VFATVFRAETWLFAASLRSCSALEQFRQPCEIDGHLSRLLYRQEACVSCSVRVSAAVEHAELLPGRVIDGESVRDLDDPPRRGEAGGHGAPAARHP